MPYNTKKLGMPDHAQNAAVRTYKRKSSRSDIDAELHFRVKIVAPLLISMESKKKNNSNIFIVK